MSVRAFGSNKGSGANSSTADGTRWRPQPQRDRRQPPLGRRPRVLREGTSVLFATPTMRGELVYGAAAKLVGVLERELAVDDDVGNVLELRSAPLRSRPSWYTAHVQRHERRGARYEAQELSAPRPSALTMLSTLDKPGDSSRQHRRSCESAVARHAQRSCTERARHG